MALAENIKVIREEKGLKQIDVAAYIGVDKSAYSKIEKGLRNVTVDELQKMATLFNLSMDQIVGFEGDMPHEVELSDKSSVEQMKMIQQLDDEDRSIIMKMIETFLTKKKFKDFFHKNVAAL